MRNATETENAIKLFGGTVYGIALTHTASKTDADDVFQETFLAFHCSRRVFADSEHEKAWLIRTAINMSRRVAHSKWRKALPPDENAAAERFEFASDVQNDIADAVRRLPEKYRVPIWLHYFDGMQVKQIAAALDRREPTVRSQLMRGRALLKDYLGKDWFIDE